MNKEILKKRLKDHALRIIKLVDLLPKTVVGRTVGNQLVRSGTSVAANYRAALRARSRAEFISKLGVVIEEADESAFWLEIIIDGEILKKGVVESLLLETNEILAIMIATSNTTRKNNNNKQI